MKKIELSNKVYEKQFQVKALGYDCQEVDSFLDEVNLEISKLERQISRLMDEKEIQETNRLALEQKVKELQIENASIKASKNVESTSGASFTNIQTLNRLANLEEKVNKILEKLNSQ